MSVLVSIIIPVYNTELNYLEQCIESIKNQSFSDYEIVIIDDCSTKIETLSYLDSLIDESIKVIHLNNNQGISNARNAGIENATGEWICFVDHDDYWEEDYLLRMVNACKNAKTDMVVSGYQVVDVDGGVINIVPNQKKDFKSPYWVYSSSAPWNRLLRRGFLIEHNISFPVGRLTEDITFNIECNCLANNSIVVESYGYCNRVNRESTSRSRKFVAMDYELMPFEYIEKNCKRISKIKDKSKKAIYQAAICEQITLLTCLFCRESSKDSKEKAVLTSGRLIRTYMKHYIGNTITYNRNVIEHRKEIKMISLGYMISIKLHMDKRYCQLVHMVLRKLM